jgi:hypothetical protein
VNSPLILSLLALLVAGCASLKETDHQPDVSGRYTEPFDPDLADVYELVSREELEFFTDGTAVSRWKFAASSPVISVLKESQVPLLTKREGGKKIYLMENKGTWRFRGDKIVYQDSESRIDPVGDFFLAVFNPKEPRSSLSSRHVFSIDSNGDLLRIPPRGHPYYAGRFVKQMRAGGMQ